MIFILAFIVLFGITYYVTGTPFGTEIPTKNQIVTINTVILAGELVALATAWLFCPIIMIVSLILIGLFGIINFGLSDGKNK